MEFGAPERMKPGTVILLPRHYNSESGVGLPRSLQNPARYRGSELDFHALAKEQSFGK